MTVPAGQMQVMWPRVPSKVLVKVGYACNNRCLFCHTDHQQTAHPRESVEVLRCMAHTAHRGFDMVAFSGGEVTIRPELLDWARAARQYGLLLGLVTNGRRLADRRLTRALYREGLRYVYLSFYGAEAATARLLSGQADCFGQQVRAVEVLAGYPEIDLTLNVPLCRQNLEQLTAIIDLFANLPRLGIKFSLLEPKGAALDHFAEVVPGLRDAAEAARAAIVYGEAQPGASERRRFGVEGLPPCLVGAEFHARYNSGLAEHNIRAMIETWEQRFYPVDELNKEHLAPCAGCALAAGCAGLFRGYRGRAQEGELDPVMNHR
jgi:MoaA/NifB/PqqE/SkfB family radical SAM enzyme